MRPLLVIAAAFLINHFSLDHALATPIWADTDDFQSPTLNTNKWKIYSGRLPDPLSARFRQTNGFVTFSSTDPSGESSGFIFWKQPLPVNQSWCVRVSARFSPSSFRVDGADGGTVEALVGVWPNLDDPRSKYVMNLAVDTNGIYSVPNWGVNSRSAGATDGEIRIDHGFTDVLLFLDYDAAQKTITGSYADAANPGLIIPATTLSTANWNGLQNFYLLMGGYSDGAIISSDTLQMDDFSVQPTDPPSYQDMVPVLDPFNPGNPDNSGAGGVNYNFAISRTEVTVRQYCRFLNSVAKRSNPVTVALFTNTFRQFSGIKTVERYTNNPNNPNTRNYSYAPAYGQDYLPMEVPWLDAARYCNWMHQGARTNADLENGAYPLGGSLTGWTGIRRNPSARFYVPSADEWYKAGYYDPNKNGPNQGGYWLTAYRSDNVTTNSSNVLVLETNRANFHTDAGWKPVGSYTNSPSYYGTYDQVGNSWEWISDRYLYDQQGLMGGNWTVKGGSDSYGPGDGATGWFYAEYDPNFHAAFRLATRLPLQGTNRCPGARGRSFSFRVNPGPEFADATFLAYSATNLPAGLSINTSSGVISGTPTTNGVFSNCLVRISMRGGDETFSVSVPLVLDIQATAPPGLALQAGQLALANQNLPEAVREFNLAVTNQPTNPTNRVYRALFSLALLQQNAAGNALLDKFYILPSPTPWDAFGDVDARQYRIAPQAYKTNTVVTTNWDNSRTTNRYVYYEPKNRGVSTTEMINLLRNVHLPVEQAVEADLATITNTNFVMTIPRGLVGSTAVTLDYGDIRMLRALLAAKRALAYFMSIHNWAMTINDWQTIVNKNGQDERVTVQNVLSTLPNLLKLNRAADGPNCRTELKKAAELYFQASDFIRNQREPGVSRLFNLDAVDYDRESLFRDRIATEWRPALDESTVVHSGDTNNDVNAIRVNGDAFFRSAGLDLRSKMPQFVTNRVRQGTFSDGTVGGLFPDLNVALMEGWLWNWTPKENEWYYDDSMGWQSYPTGLSVGPYGFGLLRAAPTIATNPLVAQVGVESSNLRIVVSNAVPQMVFSCTNLPGWATLDPFTGYISGTPLGLDDVATNRPVTIRLQAPPLGGGTNPYLTNRTLSLRVLPPAPAFGTNVPDSFYCNRGVALRFTNTTSPTNLLSLPGYPVTFGATNLPPGLFLSPNGILSGSPTRDGSYFSVLTVSNAGGASSKSLPFFVIPPGSVVDDQGFWTAGRIGDDLSYQVSFGQGYSNYSCAQLPTGLSISASGLITGRPLTEWSPYMGVRVVARRNGVWVTNEIQLHLVNSLPVLASPTNVVAALNQPFRYQIVAGGAGREWAGYDSFEGTSSTNWRAGAALGAAMVRTNGNLMLNFSGNGTNATNRFAYLDWVRNIPGGRLWIAYGTAILPSNLVTGTNRYAESLIQVVRDDGTTNLSASAFAGRENAVGYSGGSYLSLDTFRNPSRVGYGFDSLDGPAFMVPTNGVMEFFKPQGSSGTPSVAVADTRYAPLPTAHSWLVRAELELTNITWTDASAIGLALVKDRRDAGWFEMTAGTNNFPFASFSLRKNTSGTNGDRSLVLAGVTNSTTNRSVLRLELAYDAPSGNLASAFYAGTNPVALAARTNALTELISDVDVPAGDALRLAMYGMIARAQGNPLGTMRVRSLSMQMEGTVSNEAERSPIFLHHSVSSEGISDSPVPVYPIPALEAGRTVYGLTNDLTGDFRYPGVFSSWGTNNVRVRLGGDTLLGGATNGRGASAIGWEDFGVIPLWEVWYECSNLPAGLNLDQNNIPGLIYGTPTAPGTNNVTVIMNTSGGTRTNTIRIIVR
jgi:hypothetical protein